MYLLFDVGVEMDIIMTHSDAQSQLFSGFENIIETTNIQKLLTSREEDSRRKSMRAMLRSVYKVNQLLATGTMEAWLQLVRQ